MQDIPETENALVLRTDFSDNAAWESICAVIREPVGEFQAYVDFLRDPEYDGLTPMQLPSLIAQGSFRPFIFLVDRIALSHADLPILVVDLSNELSQSFRVIPSQMWSVENNLSLCNLDFADFAKSVDPDGIFRGFPER